MELVDALIARENLKRQAEEHPDRPPSAIVRCELNGLDSGVIAMLPDRENLSKSIKRARRRNLPPNPKSLTELQEIPTQYQMTLTKNRFLLFDSNEDENFGDGRVIVFATRRNLEVLASCEVWFMDGTFKVNTCE